MAECADYRSSGAWMLEACYWWHRELGVRKCQRSSTRPGTRAQGWQHRQRHYSRALASHPTPHLSAAAATTLSPSDPCVSSDLGRLAMGAGSCRRFSVVRHAGRRSGGCQWREAGGAARGLCWSSAAGRAMKFGAVGAAVGRARALPAVARPPQAGGIRDRGLSGRLPVSYSSEAQLIAAPAVE